MQPLISHVQVGVGELLAGFFRFYSCDFPTTKHVVSVRLGATTALLKKEYPPARDANKPWRLAVEDPFELSHDLGTVICSTEAQQLVDNKLMAANVDVRSGVLAQSLEDHSKESTATEAGDHADAGDGPTSGLLLRLCYNCGCDGHNAAECTEAEWLESDDDGSDSSICFKCGDVSVWGSWGTPDTPPLRQS
jgi:hypothetical protein